MSGLNGTHRGFRHAAAGPIVAAATGSLVLAFSLSPAFAASTSQFQQYLAGDGAALSIQQAALGGTAACSSFTEDGANASCAGIDLYGGKVIPPGAASSTTVVFTNTGTADARTFTATGGSCHQSAPDANSGAATDLCEKFRVRLSTPSATVFDGTATEFGRVGALAVLGTESAGIPAGGSIAVTITVTLSSDVDNSYSGLRVGQPVTWTFQS